VLNGYKFVVHPIFLGEEDEFREDVPYLLYPRRKDGQEPTEKDLGWFAIGLFKRNKSKDNGDKIGIVQRIKKWVAKHILKNSEFYSDDPEIVGLVKWIERKVYYKGKRVRFYDLERKYKLNKSEITKLFGFLQEISGF
jgi:hypothetical protein